MLMNVTSTLLKISSKIVRKLEKMWTAISLCSKLSLKLTQILNNKNLGKKLINF
jgi:hypothetical protein